MAGGSCLQPALDRFRHGDAARVDDLSIDDHAGRAHHATAHDRGDIGHLFHLDGDAQCSGLLDQLRGGHTIPAARTKHLDGLLSALRSMMNSGGEMATTLIMKAITVPMGTALASRASATGMTPVAFE